MYRLLLPNHLIVNPKEWYDMHSLQEDKIEINFPDDLLDKIDIVREYLDAGSREEFIVSATNRLVNQLMGVWWPVDPYREQEMGLYIYEFVPDGYRL